jgi:autotransporter-associated beta strand protein/T5SS/PEP-CTERM-associated repeat protein
VLFSRGLQMRAYLLTTTATMALLAALSAPARAQVSWISPLAGDWTNATNWNPGFEPTAADEAINNKGSIALVTTSGATAKSLTLGQSPGTSGAVSILAGGLLTTTGGSNVIGFDGAGVLNLSAGGRYNFGGASPALGGGIVTIDGPGSRLFGTGDAVVANQARSQMTLTNGGAFQAANLYLGNNAGTGTLDVLSGSQVTLTGTLIAGSNSGATGIVNVDGTNSLATSNGATIGSGGIGIVNLTNRGTFNAGTTINLGLFAGSSGTLNIGAGGAPGIVSGNISGGSGTAIVNFNHNDPAFVFSSVMSGTLAVNQIGSGTTTLTSVNTYTGATTVNAGALIVNGSIASSSLTTVNSGAVLSGSGAVGSTVINTGGFLVPGPVGVPGSMTVAGNLAFQPGAFYVVQVNPTTASTTNVSGTASLAGTVEATFAPGTYLTRSYTILTAAGGRTGTFDALATFGLPADFQASLSHPGNTAVLNLKAQLVPEPPIPPTPIPPVPGLPPFTVNQINVGHAIDNFFNNGGALPPAFAPLFNLNGNNLTTALDQLSGEAATGAQKAAFQLTDQFLNLMLDPFVDGRSGVGGAGQPVRALGFAPEYDNTPPEIALAYASVKKGPRAPTPVYEPRWTEWGGA